MKPKTLPALSCVLSEKTIKQLQDDLKKKNVTDLSGHLEKLFGYKEILTCTLTICGNWPNTSSTWSPMTIRWLTQKELART